VAAGAGTERHEAPFQATDTGISGPTARQNLLPEHQTEFSSLTLGTPRWRDGIAAADSLKVSGANAAMAVARTAATIPDLQPRTPDHHLLLARQRAPLTQLVN
jgi:hypothetical protein